MSNSDESMEDTGGKMIVEQPRQKAGRGIFLMSSLVERMEVFTGIETKNRYSLCNQLGQQVYFAYENSSAFGRMYMKAQRSFNMVIADNVMRPIMMIHRPTSFWGSDECLIECPPGQLIGRVIMESQCCSLEYSVLDINGQIKLCIQGPSCGGGGAADYRVFSASSMTPVGSIFKQWGGWAKEMFTDADSFIVNFPVNLDVHLKACLLGATFMIDFHSYEK